MTFARGRYGDIYGVNGLERGFRWDGITANVEKLGLTAPATKPTITSSSTTPTYFIRSVDVVDGGFGYQKVPAVTFTGGSGSGAAAKAEVLNGKIHRIVMQDYGAGYTSAPDVAVGAPDGDSPAGSGAVLTVTATGKLIDVLPTNFGSGYTSPPTVTVSGGGGSGAIIRTEINAAGEVATVVIANPGSGYTSAPTLTFSAPPSGTTAAGTAVVGYRVDSVAVTTAGTGYSGTPRVTFLSADGGGAYAECTVGTGVTSGQITGVTVKQGGLYRVAPTASIETPTGLKPREAKLTATAQPSIQGKYWCALRYVDDTPASSNGPIASSITELAEIELAAPAESLTWSWSNTGAEARASRLELWRTSADQALVLYRVASLPRDGSGNFPTSYTDTFSDADLINPERPASATGASATDVVTATSHGMQDGDSFKFLSLTGGAGLTAQTTYYVRDATANTFKVAASAGGVAINFTTDISAASVTTGRFGALPIVLPNGQPNARRFQPPPTDKSSIVMFQDRAWYGVDTSGTEPNSLYFSEVDEPESVPDSNELVIQENVKGTDKISALMPFGAAMVVFQQRHAYRLSYAAQPVIDASIILLAQRGCLNQRCWDTHDGVAYVVDSVGMYVFDGSNAVPLSDSVDTFWTDNIIHFASSKWFFVRVDPLTRIVRFFHAVSAGMPDRALCYHPMTKAWWVEVYAQTFAASECVISGNRQKIVVGGQSGSLYLFDAGSQDIDSAGASAGIACTYRTGNLPFDPKEQDRGIRLLYRPTTNDCNLSLALHYNNSSTARPAAVKTDRGTGFTTDGGSSATLNLKLTRSALGDATGYAVCAYSGRVDDKSAGADRHVAINVSGTRTSGDAMIVHGMAISGVSQ
jgi:hypothetical protein